MMPSIVRAELLLGPEKQGNRKKYRQVQAFCQAFHPAPFDDVCAATYARLRSNLEFHGNTIGPNDLIIAATALTLGATLVTNNVKEFTCVPLLKVESWCEVEL
ncbi:MAG: type II toxin-antitoxin system VapC family toxin [Coriobacteriia bacterium]|nr:type II toxin-antitoxin system VapC family toxin [Coriobacteriia bacterium]